MTINLDGISIREFDNTTISQEELTRLVKFMKNSLSEPDPVANPILAQSINAMLDRWGFKDAAKRTELTPLITKLYHYRLKQGESRIFWRLLKANLGNLFV